MPYLKIQTNLPIAKKAEDKLLKEASLLVAQELDKPEDFVMIALQPDTPMYFAGSDHPAAFLDLKGIGLPETETKKLSETLCAFIADHLGIPKERIYVNFTDVRHDMWGWKGTVF